MKRYFLSLLAVVLCLSLTACGKSEEVKHVQTMIKELGEITLDSADAIYAIDEAYDALTEEEQKKVSNYEEFKEAKNAFYKLYLVGNWYACDLNLFVPEVQYTHRYWVTLNADMTASCTSDRSPMILGNWDVVNGDCLQLKLNSLETETYGRSSSGGGYEFTIKREDGILRFEDDMIRYVREEDYPALLEEVLLEVDCSTANLSDYLGFTSQKVADSDEWGAHTGTEYTKVCLENKLYNEGWMFLGVDQDFAIEIVYPEYTETYLYEDGDTYSSQAEGGSCTINENPFSISEVSLNLAWSFPDSTVETDLTLENLSFGRGKGHLYFIKKDYVTDIRKTENDERELVFDVNADSIFIFPESVTCFFWEEGNNDY